MKTLFQEVRTSKNLFSAWRHVRRSALNSDNCDIRGKASEFEHRHQSHLRRIQESLRDGSFAFDEYEGALKDKKSRLAAGKDPRPIAIGSMQNRVVQRAILQVLQPRKEEDPTNLNTKFSPREDPRLGKLNDVNRSRFGVGGLMRPYGGVERGVTLVMDAMKRGSKHYYQSDIKSFFTKIPTTEVIDKIKNEIGDDPIVDLFTQALVVNLSNKNELSTYARLFPFGGIGVAQGSSLSAFAANVLLYDFDHELNKLGVTAVRYIDDLFILSETEEILDIAIRFSADQLGGFGFSLYTPTPGSTKAARGLCRDSFGLLGCTLQPNKCSPSKQSVRKTLSEIAGELSRSKNAIKEHVHGIKKLDPKLARSCVIDRIGKRLYGWEKSFSFCNSPEAVSLS